jgi:hypothetical protein
MITIDPRSTFGQTQAMPCLAQSSMRSVESPNSWMKEKERMQHPQRIAPAGDSSPAE